MTLTESAYGLGFRRRLGLLLLLRRFERKLHQPHTGTLIGSSTNSGTSYSVTWNTPLPADGQYQIVATATDNAGNTSAASPSTLDWRRHDTANGASARSERIPMMSPSRLLFSDRADVSRSRQ